MKHEKILADRLFFRAWIESKRYMAIQGTSGLETLQLFMFHHGNEKNIMQYTGLNDVNNNKIFEGDIIQYTQHHFNTEMIKRKRKIVKWKYDKWGVYETNAGESDVKIIGNIFENPIYCTINEIDKIVMNKDNKYVLIKIGTNNLRNVELCSKRKNKLEKYIKEKGFYWSKKANRYINDKTCGIKGGSGTDYIIHKINELI